MFNSNNSEIVGFPDYNQVSKYRLFRKGGGVSLLVKDWMKFHELTEFSQCDDILESIFIELDMFGENVVIGCIYRPPNSNMAKFSENIASMLKKINKHNKHVYLMGDFNIDLLKVDEHQPTSEFINMMFSSSFIPLITHPTRVTKNSATLIDNIFTNRLDSTNVLNGILPTDVSDHFF